MPPDEPTFDNWKDAWEWHATQTHEAFLGWAPADLLAAADAGRYDGYYTLWEAIRAGCTLADAAPVQACDRRARGADPGADGIRRPTGAALNGARAEHLSP